MCCYNLRWNCIIRYLYISNPFLQCAVASYLQFEAVGAQSFRDRLGGWAWELPHLGAL